MRPVAGGSQVGPRRVRGDRGASALELTFVAPGVLLFLFFSIQAGLYFYGRAVAEQAAREGVSKLRLAQTQAISDGIRQDVQTAVEAYAAAVGRETLLDPEATTTYDDAEGKVSVTVTGSVITLIPGLDLRVTQRVFGEIERFEGDQR
ncbi:MAG: pilus assembly protein [Frankiales bacterium]|nr:pilus assembly protein [Frankiales bacterium]